jgi:hypothetical protein
MLNMLYCKIIRIFVRLGLLLYFYCFICVSKPAFKGSFEQEEILDAYE